MSFYLSTFHPLCINAGGRRAAATFAHPPFVDGSIRREPDFESTYPSISCVCHGANFAPRLRKEDRVVFLTVKSTYPGHPRPHWRLVAALEVIERFDSHTAGAAWYRSRGLPSPGNCMVRENPPLGVDHSSLPNRDPREWDVGYWARTRRNGTFLVTKKDRILELYDPAVITEGDLVTVFGKLQATRNPPAIKDSEYAALVAIAEQWKPYQWGRD